MDEYQIKVAFYHSLQSIWANIDDVAKRPLREDSIPLIRAHIWNCILTRNHTLFPQIINMFVNGSNEMYNSLFSEGTDRHCDLYL